MPPAKNKQPSPHVEPAAVQLTERQQDLLDALQKFWDKHNYAPSFEELRVMLNWSTRSLVSHHAHGLRALGMIEFEDSRSRTIRRVPPTITD